MTWTLYIRALCPNFRKITFKSTRHVSAYRNRKKRKNKKIRFSVMCCQSRPPGVTCHSLDVIYSFGWSLKIEVRPNHGYFYRNMRR